MLSWLNSKEGILLIFNRIKILARSLIKGDYFRLIPKDRAEEVFNHKFIY